MAATLLLGVAAVNTGNNLLFLVVSAMLGFMAVSGLLGWLNIRGLAVSVRLPDEVYAGISTQLTVRVENRKRLLPSFLITATLLGHPASFLLLDPRKAQTGSLLVAFPQRGRIALPVALISSAFPVNFFVRNIRVPVTGSLLVFPAPRSLALPAGAGKPENGNARSLAAPGHEGELAKISDYQGGESLKLIHWRLSAKHEDYKVKHLTSNATEPVLIEIDTLPGRDLEERLGYGTFLVNRLVRGGSAVGLKLAQRVITPAASRSHRLKLLGELAVYGQS
ncbi:hypothetical protein GMLC_38110 [Geomonas limicola]|uniref:Uncharacterized protein n=1 Tax=Geomonas limicola TaxID=2740186 RepID=A0A6V8NC88_9BACT|nr:DUF58 domain-containing protein [Geomonas limicola]GFO70232.1 hypothetical protein GMLC_38110 [Geomonas limicola]